MTTPSPMSAIELGDQQPSQPRPPERGDGGAEAHPARRYRRAAWPRTVTCPSCWQRSVTWSTTSWCTSAGRSASRPTHRRRSPGGAVAAPPTSPRPRRAWWAGPGSSDRSATTARPISCSPSSWPTASTCRSCGGPDARVRSSCWSTSRASGRSSPTPAPPASLDDPDPAWLDGVDVLHVPVYSLVDEPIATTDDHHRRLGARTRDRGVDRRLVGRRARGVRGGARCSGCSPICGRPWCSRTATRPSCWASPARWAMPSPT